MATHLLSLGRSRIVQPHTRHLVIVGLVQGVGFRYAMTRKAAELGVRGWVRNRSDGTVEAMVQGGPDAVAAIMAWARQGPRSARIDRIEAEPGEGEFDSFTTLPTE